MKLTQRFLARFLASMLAMFFLGMVLVMIGAEPVFGIAPLILLGSTMVVISVLGGIIGLGIAFMRAINPPPVVPRGMRTRLPAKVYYKYRQDSGVMIADDEPAEGQESFVVVLITKTRRRMEVETAEPVYARCAEGMWGWAWIEGNWMGRFDPDQQLHRQMESEA